MTGRPVCRAAITTSARWGRASTLEPNPPPTYGVITWTRSGGSPNSVARSPRTRCGPWLESYTVSPSSVQTAIVACGSIGLLCTAGVVYVSSTVTAAAASADSTSPSAVSVGWPALMIAGVSRSSRSTRRTTSWGRSSYRTVTRSAASRAVSSVSATTAATTWPRYATASDWSTSHSTSWNAWGLGTSGCSRGAFSCVSTASTPGRASAATASTATTRPAAIVLWTGTAYAACSSRCSYAYVADPVTLWRPSTRSSGVPVTRATPSLTGAPSEEIEGGRTQGLRPSM